MSCPTEILQLIVFHLPLRSAMNLRAGSPRLSSLISDNERDFWRPHILRLHGSWFRQLWDRPSFSKDSLLDQNWEQLLKMLDLSRHEIMKGAQPYWHISPAKEHIDTANNHEHSKDDNTQSLPLGLRNRQRIWMCLESLNIDDKLEKSKE